MTNTSSDIAYGWVRSGPIDVVAQRHRAIRDGDLTVVDGEQARPATAIRALYEFAIQRSTDDLVECLDHFDAEDAMTVLSVAALDRDVADAADLAIKVWRVEGGPNGAETLRTDRIIYELAGQRIALRVAEFVRSCNASSAKLATKTLRVFVRRRTNRDKALFFYLLRDGGCKEDATTLLRLSLATLTDDGPMPPHETDPAELHDLVGALYQLSPSERVLEGWISQELEDPDQLQATKDLVVKLVISQRKGPTSLVEYLGRRLTSDMVVPVCVDLCAQSPEWCATVRSYIALRRENKDLATIVYDWYQSKTLGRTTRDLLIDIVTRAVEATGGALAPRSFYELTDLGKRLRNKGDIGVECAQLLWMVAAEYVTCDCGGDLVALLGNIKRWHDRQRAARTIAGRLAVEVHNGRDQQPTIDYLVELRATNDSEAVYSARRELSDPSQSERPVQSNPTAIADIAVELYRREHDKDGWDLLERYLENEQALRPDDVVLVVKRLHDSRMSENDRLFLLRATVGRWSDVHRRDLAEKTLREQGFEKEADKIVLSLR